VRHATSVRSGTCKGEGKNVSHLTGEEREYLMELLLFAVFLLALDLVAMHWGTNSKDTQPRMETQTGEGRHLLTSTRSR
jgi:hypothetical protein